MGPVRSGTEVRGNNVIICNILIFGADKNGMPSSSARLRFIVLYCIIITQIPLF